MSDQIELQRREELKRKRSAISVSSDEEVEKESNNRSSVKTQKKVSYYENEEEEDVCDLTKQEDSLLVKCGSKEGFLYKNKLKQGQACVLCEGKWFTPLQFEEFGGKRASKKWKSTITHQGEPLSHWITKGLLTTVGYLKRQINQRKLTKKKSSNHAKAKCSEDEGIESENVSPVADDLSDPDITEECGIFTLSKKAVIPLERLAVREQLRIPSQPTSSTITQPEAHQLTNSSQLSVESWRVPLSEELQSEEEKHVNDTPPTAEARGAASPPMPAPPTTEVILIERPQEKPKHPAVGSDDHDATQSPHSEPKQETHADEACGHSPNVPGAVENCDVDMMDLEQLAREKLKLEVKVLSEVDENPDYDNLDIVSRDAEDKYFDEDDDEEEEEEENDDEEENMTE